MPPTHPTPSPPPTTSLVVTDLDGTLWDTDDHVPATTLAAVRELRRRGVPLLVATGRRIASTREPLARIGLAPPAVVLNGAIGLHLDTGTRFHTMTFREDEAAAVLAGFHRVGLSPVVHVADPDEAVEPTAFMSPTTSTHPDHAASMAPLARIDDLDRIVVDRPVLAFSLIGIAEHDARAAAVSIGGAAETHLGRSRDFAGLATLTVAPAGLSKWDGVEAFCRSHGLDHTRVVALADGSNDLELLERAALALVPTDADADALDRADHLIPPAGEGGWARVLDYV
ncbi:MAG: HAD family hydrolase [Microthrixaceae bacterium]